MKYVLEYAAEHPDTVGIHIRERLTEFDYENWDYPGDKSEYGTGTPEWAVKIFDIKGIDSVSCSRYTIDVYKGGAFDWDELLPEILAVVKAYFSLNEELVEKEPPRQAWEIVSDEDTDDEALTT